MPLFEIKNRFDGKLIFSLECDSMKLCVEAAVKAYANLRSANLTSANLRSADLRSANLTSADLTSANLMYANLRSANLRSANLRSADLTYANLRSADLTSANLMYANLRSADLRSANLTSIRDDFWAVLSASPCEVGGLRAALCEGRVDGGTYEGACAGLVGTIANLRQLGFNCVPLLSPNSDRPAERFFLSIRNGDTPQTNQFAKLAVEWIDEWPPLRFILTSQVA